MYKLPMLLVFGVICAAPVRLDLSGIKPGPIAVAPGGKLPKGSIGKRHSIWNPRRATR